jgi:predicted nuclease of predicted toxin-antitoxin system
LILLADECVEKSLVDALRRDGFSIEYISEISPGASDQEVLERARSTGAMLLTADKDFGEIVFRQGRVPEGVILLRLHGLPAARRHRIVSTALRAHEQEMLSRFTVITPSSVRIGRHVEAEER